MLSVSLERLLKALASGVTCQYAISEEQTQKILDYVRGLGFDENVVRRFDGFINAMGQVSPKNLLHTLKDRGALGICREDIVAWRTVRDRVAHGGSLFTGERELRQEHVTAISRLTNLFVKLLLNAMEYDGKYVDRFGSGICDFVHEDLLGRKHGVARER